MKSIHIAVLLMIFLVTSTQSQDMAGNHDSTYSPAMLRVKAMQNEIKKQQVEIDALRLRLGKLQQAFEDLAQMVADQSTDADDDDIIDDSGVSALVVDGHTDRSQMYRGQATRTKSFLWSSKARSGHRSRAIPKRKVPLTRSLEY